MIRSKRCLSVVAGMVLVCSPHTVFGQQLVSRSSTADVSATYGGGGDVSTPNGSASNTSLVLSDSLALSYSDSRNGFINNDPGRPWSASVSSSTAHGYTVSGSLANFSEISASGGTTVAAAAGGEGLATISSGSALELRFTLANATDMRLVGSVSLIPDGQNLASYVTLQRFDGFAWANVFNSLFLPGQEGTFDNSFNLLSGDYRIIGSSSGNAYFGVRPSQDNAWNYRLQAQAVPEPGTAALLAMSAVGGLKRLRARRRSS